MQRLGAVPLAPRQPTAAPAEADQREPDFHPRDAARSEELDRQCMELEATVAELRHRLQEAAEDAEKRVAEALERGRREGRNAAESGEKLRLETLASALGEIKEEHRARLGDCELLALQLARTALSRVLGEAEAPAELVSATLAHHLARMKPDLVQGLRVSPEDFADAGALEELAQAHGGIAIRADGNLAAGECEIDLKLGKIDLGLGRQWQRLSAYFEELADEGRRG